MAKDWNLPAPYDETHHSVTEINLKEAPPELVGQWLTIMTAHVADNPDMEVIKGLYDKYHVVERNKEEEETE